MKILHLSQYYPPESGAVQVRADKVDRYLVGRGHKVSVIAEVPNHPSGIIWPEYRKKIYQSSSEDGVDVLRIWVKTTANKNFKTRLAFYLTYMIGAAIAGIILPRRFDVVFANSPPLPVAAAGAFVSLIRRKPFVMEVQDLWPKSAIEMGEMRSKKAIALATWLENFCYRRAEKVLAVSPGILQDLADRFPAEKLVFCSNGSNTDIFQPRPDSGQLLKQKLGVENKFLIVYGGILGAAQGLEVMLQTAKVLEDRSDIHFLIVGEGPRKQALLKLFSKLGLTNLTMIPGQPLKKMPDFFSAADLCLVPLRKLDVFKGVLPTKMFDAWACRTPTLINVDGDARQVLEKAGAGIFVEPENSQALADAILQLKSQPDKLTQMGMAGYQAVQKEHSLQAAAKEIEIVFQKVAANS